MCKAWVVVRVFFATLQRFATFFEFVAVIAVTDRLKFVRRGRAYIQCCGGGLGVVGGRKSQCALGSWRLEVSANVAARADVERQDRPKQVGLLLK